MRKDRDTMLTQLPLALAGDGNTAEEEEDIGEDGVGVEKHLQLL